MKTCVLEDSNFVIAIINRNDELHLKAVTILNELVERREKIKICIPSVVFFESIIKLIQRGVPSKLVEEKLWDFLYREEILNVTFPETAAFKLIKYLKRTNLELKATDAIIALTGIEYEAHIITFDKVLYNELQNIGYKRAYFCCEENEQNRFLKEIDKDIRGGFSLQI